jgi:ADP-ribose pyrophosphatase
MEKIAYKGKIIEVIEKEVEQAGKKLTFEYARRSPGVRLIIPKAGKILVSKEFRHEVGGYDYRLPGGKVFDTLEEYNHALEANADLLEAAKAAGIREAREEVGIEATKLSFFHTSICGATVIWDLHYFLVEAFDEAEQDLGEGEDISFEFLDKEKVRSMCLDGSISEERSALTLLRYLSS